MPRVSDERLAELRALVETGHGWRTSDFAAALDDLADARQECARLRAERESLLKLHADLYARVFGAPPVYPGQSHDARLAPTWPGAAGGPAAGEGEGHERCALK